MAPTARIAVSLAALACAALAAASLSHRPAGALRTLSGRSAGGTAVTVRMRGAQVESFTASSMPVRCASGYRYVAEPLRGKGNRLTARGTYPDGSTAFLTHAALHVGEAAARAASLRYDVDLYARAPIPVDHCSSGPVAVALRPLAYGRSG